jgi:DNA-directed RNA polymerase subunit H (RpoH/RPB5)
MEVSTSSNFFGQLYKVRSTIVELMEEQGYNASKYSNFSIAELQTMLKNNELDMMFEKNDKKALVKFYEITGESKKTLKQPILESLVTQYFDLEETLAKTDDLIIVVNEDPTETIQNVMKHIWEQQGIYVNIISVKRLQFNVLTHSLVPKHSLLSNEDKQDFYKKYNIKRTNEIPEISRFDAVANAICMRPDDVCKIIRPSKTSIEGIYYRNCVNK